MFFTPRLALILITVLCTCGSAQMWGQGIEFFHGTWAEALEKAETEDKLIFVDAYASWCGPCKRMAADVFPEKKVGDYFNANFINVKFDMEKSESRDFRRTHSVRAYPTLLFINAKNEVVHKTVGGKQVESLLKEGGNALNKMDNIEDLAEEWAEGDHDSQLALRYIRAMVRQNENHAKIANDYLRGQQDLTTPDNLDILLIAATNADSRIYDLLVENKDAVIARSGQEAFIAQVKSAVLATKDKALEYRDDGLMKTAIKKYALVDPAASKALELQVDFEAAAKGDDEKAFLKATKKYLTKGAAGDADQLQQIFRVGTSSKFSTNEKVFDLALQAGVQAAQLDQEQGFRKYYKLAELMMTKGRMDEALNYAQLSMIGIEHLTAGKRKQVERAINALIGKIEAAR